MTLTRKAFLASLVGLPAAAKTAGRIKDSDIVTVDPKDVSAGYMLLPHQQAFLASTTRETVLIGGRMTGRSFAVRRLLESVDNDAVVVTGSLELLKFRGCAHNKPSHWVHLLTTQKEINNKPCRLRMLNGNMPPVLILDDADDMDPAFGDAVANNKEIKKVYYTIGQHGITPRWFDKRFQLSLLQILTRGQPFPIVRSNISDWYDLRRSIDATVIFAGCPRPLGLDYTLR